MLTAMEGLEPYQKHLPSLLPRDLCGVASGHSLVSNLRSWPFPTKLEFLKTNQGPPWWLSGKESACRCKRLRFNPQSRKIPHATEQLSPRTTIEPVLYSQGSTATETCSPQSLCYAAGEATALQRRAAPACCNQRRAHAAAKTQHSQKQINKNK